MMRLQLLRTRPLKHVAHKYFIPSYACPPPFLWKVGTNHDVLNEPALQMDTESWMTFTSRRSASGRQQQQVVVQYTDYASTTTSDTSCAMDAQSTISEADTSTVSSSSDYNTTAVFDPLQFVIRMCNPPT